MLQKLFLAIICTFSLQPGFSQIAAIDKNSPLFQGPIPARYVQSSNVNLNRANISTLFFENTAKVIAPSASIPRGLIVISTGQPRDQSGIETRPLLQTDYKSFQATTPINNPNNFSQYYPFSSLVNSYSKVHTDNQTAKLPNGDVLIVKEHCTWGAIRNPPKWINESIEGEGGFHNGNRGAWSFFKVSASGTEHKAELVSTLDLGVFEGGKYAYPQPSGDHWWIGGQDRSEIYACPYTGNIYLACKYTSGPYKGYSGIGTLLLVSKDNAKTWKLVKEFPYGADGIYAPMVMTSTPNKRLIIFSGYGSDGGMELPRICYSKLSSMGSDKIEMAGPYFVKVNDENGKLINFQYNKETVDMFQNTAYFCSISRINEDPSVMRSWVRVSVHMKNADNNMEAKIFKILIRDETNPPVGTFIKTIKAENPKTNSVLYGSFIDPSPWEIPSPGADLSAFYWVEAPKAGASPHLYSARFVLVSGDKVSSPAYLSVKEKTGTARTWTKQQDIGDYFSGGFYYHDGHYNYLAQWMEPDGIVANIISVPIADVVKFSANGF